MGIDPVLHTSHGYQTVVLVRWWRCACCHAALLNPICMDLETIPFTSKDRPQSGRLVRRLSAFSEVRYAVGDVLMSSAGCRSSPRVSFFLTDLA